MRRSSHKSKRRKRIDPRDMSSGQMVLQITSMVDVFTILLVFLLKSFASGDSGLSVSQNLMLPEANAGDQLIDAEKVEINAKGVEYDGKKVSDLADFKFDSSDIESNGTARSLNNAFIDKRRSNRSPTSLTAGLLVLADRHTPYTTLKTVLDTAAGNGYGEVKLVVVETQ